MTSTTKLALRATALAAFTMVSASAFADFDANIELNNTYQNNGRGLTQDGRVEVNASKKVGTQYFMAGRASLLAKKDGTAGTDDMWAQFGSETADIKLGRFEATNLYETPGDTYVDHADGGANIYNGNVLRGRKDSNVFHAAVNVKLGGGLGLEVGVVETKLAGLAKGVRPILTYANGPLSLAAGFEAITYNGSAAVAAVAGTTTTGTITVGGVTSPAIFTTPATPAVAAGNSVHRTGFGLTGAYDFGGFSLRANLDSGKNAANDKMTGYGLIAQAGPATFGFLGGRNKTTDVTISTFYAAYAIAFFDVKGATITPAVSFSKASGAGSTGIADSSGARVRINYAF